MLDLFLLEQQGAINKAQADNARKWWDLELTGMSLENILTQSKTNLTNEQIKEVKQNVINSIDNKLTNIRNANTAERNMLINEWNVEIQKELRERGLDNEEIKIFMDGVKMIFDNGSYMSKK